MSSKRRSTFVLKLEGRFGAGPIVSEDIRDVGLMKMLEEKQNRGRRIAAKRRCRELRTRVKCLRRTVAQQTITWGVFGRILSVESR